LQKLTEKVGWLGAVELLTIRLLELVKMDHKEPKTRTEKKGRDKQGGSGPYSAKHVRLQEAARAAASVTRVAEGKGAKGK